MTRRSIALSTEQQSIIKHPDIINLVGALAHKTTQLLKRPPSEEEELRNVGLSTLPEIVLRFDEARGVTFVTFAYRRIRGAMIDHIRKSSGYSRSEKKAATHVSISENRAAERLFYSGTKALENLHDQTVLIGERSLAKHVVSLMEKLGPKEQAIMRLHYIEGLSFVEISRHIGCTESWTSRLHERALAHLREMLRSAEEATTS